MTIQELEQAILQAIETMYECKYVGLLKLTKLPDKIIANTVEKCYNNQEGVV